MKQTNLSPPQVQHFFKERGQQPGAALAMRSYFVRSVPDLRVTCRSDVKPGTFQARDNVSNFISWCRHLGIPDVLRFETDDLVMRKNERSVILCLLELARVGAKLGMLAPTLVRMEQEIDEELESGEPPPQIKTCDMKSLDELVGSGFVLCCLLGVWGFVCLWCVVFGVLGGVCFFVVCCLCVWGVCCLWCGVGGLFVVCWLVFWGLLVVCWLVLGVCWWCVVWCLGVRLWCVGWCLGVCCFGGVFLGVWCCW